MASFDLLNKLVLVCASICIIHHVTILTKKRFSLPIPVRGSDGITDIADNYSLHVCLLLVTHGNPTANVIEIVYVSFCESAYEYWGVN